MFLVILLSTSIVNNHITNHNITTPITHTTAHTTPHYSTRQHTTAHTVKSVSCISNAVLELRGTEEANWTIQTDIKGSMKGKSPLLELLLAQYASSVCIGGLLFINMDQSQQAHVYLQEAIGFARNAMIQTVWNTGVAPSNEWTPWEIMHLVVEVKVGNKFSVSWGFMFDS